MCKKYIRNMYIFMYSNMWIYYISIYTISWNLKFKQSLLLIRHKFKFQFQNLFQNFSKFRVAILIFNKKLAIRNRGLRHQKISDLTGIKLSNCQIQKEKLKFVYSAKHYSFLGPTMYIITYFVFFFLSSLIFFITTGHVFLWFGENRFLRHFESWKLM